MESWNREIGNFVISSEIESKASGSKAGSEFIWQVRLEVNFRSDGVTFILTSAQLLSVPFLPPVSWLHFRSYFPSADVTFCCRLLPNRYFLRRVFLSFHCPSKGNNQSQSRKNRLAESILGPGYSLTINPWAWDSLALRSLGRFDRSGQRERRSHKTSLLHVIN